MSNLQMLARRCPVMSKAMAAQSARPAPVRSTGGSGFGGGCPFGKRNYHTKADFHTTGIQGATANDTIVRKDDGMRAEMPLTREVD